jgi:hypothetical protein
MIKHSLKALLHSFGLMASFFYQALAQAKS